MRTGRPPKPTALKRLQGNPGKRKLPKNEPKPAADESLLTPPRWLDPEAKAEWRRVAPSLYTLGLLTNADRTSLSAYCKAYSRWYHAEKSMDREGLEVKTPSGFKQAQPKVAIAKGYAKQMQELAAQFGFTPASRTRLAAEGDPPEDDYEKYRAARRMPQQSQEQEPNAPSRSLH